MNEKLEKILSIPKSLYVSYRKCKNVPFWKLPVLIRWNAKVMGGGNIVVNQRVGRISIGFGNVGIYSKYFSPSILELSGTIVISGKVYFGHGSKISVSKGATLVIGENFHNTAEARIICQDNIVIGRNVLFGWETTVMDTDFHSSINLINGDVSVCHSPVMIADNVWTGQRSTILKGCTIAKGCIVASCSVVTKSFEEENVLIAGNPAIIKKKSITLYKCQ